jgi:hypothetical protein
MNLTELGDLLLKLYFEANYSIEDIQREVNETIEVIKYGQKINENENN